MKHSIGSLLRTLFVLIALTIHGSIATAAFPAHNRQGAAPSGDTLELGFEQGTPGQTPGDWFVPTPGWTAELVDAMAVDGKVSLMLKQREATDAPFGNVMRALDAAPYQGKRVRLTALILAQGPAESQAMMWLRADLDDGTTGAFDNMQDRPVRPAPGSALAPGDWTTASISLDIEPNAKQLSIGFLSVGGATVFVDAVNLTVEGVGSAVAPQEASAPLPLSDRGEQNLEAATRLLSYVRFFHASDQVTAVTDWDHLAVALVEWAEPAENADDLAQRLGNFFAPLAPTLQVWAGGSDHAPSLPDQPESVQRVVYWRHTGVGGLPGSMATGAYSSMVQRDRLSSGVWGKGHLDTETYVASFLVKPLGGGVACRLPVKLFADGQGTVPHVPTPTEWSSAVGQPRLTGDNRSTRLAGVALCWGVMQHFYPYFDVVDTDWDAALAAALHSAAEDADRVTYLHTLQELVAKLHDGHGHVIAPGVEPQTMIPLNFGWAGNHLVVGGVDASVASKVNVGDEVLSIEGRSVSDWSELLSGRISAATDGWRRARLRYEFAVAVPSDQLVRLQMRRPSGEEYNVELDRIPTQMLPARTDQRPESGTELAPGIVYFNLDGASSEDFTAALPKLEAARGIVFDLRGYPGGAGTDVVRHLSSELVRSARWNIPVATLPDREGRTWNTRGRWQLPPLEPRLNAKVVFLTDGRAISYAESIMGIVEAYHMGAIVGATTAGTNGNVNPFDLPGGYRVTWTGMKVLKHDGSQHHGVGIAPTVPVEPTIAGIAAGRDEVLEKGVEVLQKQLEADPAG